jgi:heme/copper-type cytochrome/quinol oxidase subunit 4
MTNKLIVISRGSLVAYTFVLIGTVVQAFHNYYFAINMSAFGGGTKIIEAALTAAFISCALMYFLIKAGDESLSVAQVMNYKKIAYNFQVFETFVNLFYYSKILIADKWIVVDGKIDWTAPNWYVFILAAIPFSIALPYFLKIYGGEIKKEKPFTDTSKDFKLQINDKVYKAKIL